MKNFLKICLIAIICFGSNIVLADDDISPDYDISDLDAMDKVLCNPDITPSFQPSDALAAIIDTPVDVLGILAKNLYLRTNRIAKRDINTMPSFVLFHNWEDEYCLLFRFLPFFNQTSLQHYFLQSEFIKSYININDQDIINKLSEASKFVEKNIPDFIALFTDAKLEDRRAGIMFQWLKNWRKTSLQFTVPFLYQERNYIFTEEEIVDIKQSDFFSSSTNNSVEEKAIRKKAVADMLGFADLNIRLSTIFVNWPATKLRLGLELNLPTGFALKKGLVGGNFTCNCERPPFNLYKFIDLISSTGDPEKKQCAIEIGKELGIQAVNRMDALILQTWLGNNNHANIGLTIEPQITCSDYLILNNLLTITYVLPQKENRYYLRVKNPEYFNKAIYQKLVDPCKLTPPGPTCNQEANLDALIFLQNQILNTLFPECVETIVFPGFQIQYSFAPTIYAHDWDLMFGLDFMYQQGETLSPKCINPANFYSCIVPTPYWWQTKIFIQIKRLLPRKKHDFYVGLNGDVTFASKNIGKDFTFALDFEFDY